MPSEPDLSPVYARVVEVSVDCMPRRSSKRRRVAPACHVVALAKMEALAKADPFSSCHTNAASYDSACQR